MESDDPKSITAYQAAVAYKHRGWSVVPVPHQSKKVLLDDWPNLRLTEDELPAHFPGGPQNVGVLTGEPSGWLIDIDLDHPRAVELAAEYLPPTPAKFGRASKPCSHWLYGVSAPLATKKFRSKSAGMIVEVRSTGCQTVMPPSTHESGELIEWTDSAAEPARIDPGELVTAVERLHEAVLAELGEKAPVPTNLLSVPSPTPAAPSALPPTDRVSRCLAAMRRMQMFDHSDGSSRLFAVACRVVEHDLNDADGLAAIRQYAHERPFPSEWSDEQILRRIRDAERACERGKALREELDEQGYITLGAHDPNTGKLVLSLRRTLPTAEAFLREFHRHPEGRTLHSYGEQLLGWNGSCYTALEEEAARQQLHHWLHEALRYVQTVDGMKLVPFDANPNTVKAALETIRAYVHLTAARTVPMWLDGRAGPRPVELLPCRTCFLHLPTMQRLPATPALFVTNALSFDPDPAAPVPTAWYEFLHQLFDGDIKALELLQEWFGYALTADTSQQKMLLICGPRRSGKGTLARVLTQLVGPDNVCGPTTSSLAGNFGLQPLLGKSLAIVSDARFAGKDVSTTVERLLCISGEDAVSVDRKYLTSVTTKLTARLMFLTNEVPQLNDAERRRPSS